MSERARKSLPYMPGLDGLRAVAVLGVLLYHADVPWMPGGFLGVEVFFVISGYLITSLLLAEWAGGADTDRPGPRIDLKRFWIRRARRLLPALYLLLVVTTAYVALRMPHELRGLGGDLAAALTYVTNWYLIAGRESYFEIMGRPSTLKHLWSLAVEEQFYIFWPILLALALRLLRRRGAFLFACLATVASAVAMAWLLVPSADPSRVYYGTDTRAAGLLAGAALAFVWDPWRLRADLPRRRRWAVDLVALALLAATALWLCLVQESDVGLYRGGFLLLDLTTIGLIAAVVHPGGRVGQWLGVAPLRWIGLRSYGIYLWHWPVFVVSRPWIDLRLDGVGLLAYRLAFTFLLAEASYRWVEQPLRHGDPRRLVAVLRRPPWTWQRPVALRRDVAATALQAVAMALLALPVMGFTPLAIRGAGVTAEASDVASIVGREDGIATVTAEVGAATAAPTGSQATDGPATPEATRPPVLPIERLRAPWIANALRARDELRARRDAPRGASADPQLLDPVIGSLGGRVPLTTTIQVTFIGDSVMLGAAPALEEVFGPTALVDATISRQFFQGVETARAYRALDLLGDVVVVHLGNNGNVSAEQFDALMEELTAVPEVVFLNVKVPRRWESSVNETVAGGVERWSNASLLDWRAASYYEPQLFLDDGIHLRPDGRQYYAYLILEAISRALGR